MAAAFVPASAAWGSAVSDAAGLPTDVRLLQWAARWTLVLAMLTLLAVVATWLLRQPWWSLNRIRLEGDLNRSSVATVRANAVPRLSGNFFTLDLQAARRAFESVPWVRQAEVRRHWPGELRVVLHEHRAAALWPGEDGHTRDDRMVGSDGRVFQANPGDVEDENLPVFRGPEGSAEAMLTVHRLLSPVLAPVGRVAGGQSDAAIRTLSLTAKGSWTAELDTGARIELGRGDGTALVARAEQFARTLPQAVEPFRRPVLHADLRHVDGYALRLAGVTTQAQGGTAAAAPRAPKKKP